MMPGSAMPMRGPPGQAPRPGGGMRSSMGRGDYDYDYDYYGYGDYRGGYSDPYYDDYYRYEDYYYDFPPAPPQARGRGRQPQSELDDGSTMNSTSLYYEVNSGMQAGRGRGVVARGRAGGPPARGAAANRAGRGGAAGVRGAARQQPARGGARAKGSLPGKRKLDGGHQNQGESKRRYQSNWGSQPLAQQPLGAAGVNGEQQWYQDSYGSWS